MPAVQQWLTIEQLSDRLQIEVKTLRDWRYKGTGPKGTKFGTARSSPIRYDLADVIEWEKSVKAAS